MQENLRTRVYNDGTEIRFDNSGGTGGSTSQIWAGNGLKYGAYTLYAHDSVATPSSNLSNYGYLYNWYAAKGIITDGGNSTKNICPDGWHVPSDSDWNKLVKFLDPINGDTSGIPTQSITAGGKMKSTGNNTAGTGLWNSPNTGADNTSEFSARPGGFRIGNGSFYSIRDYAYFWSDTQIGTYSGSSAWSRYMNTSNGNVTRSNTDRPIGASIRCLRN
jgi:uncharacterized protein (TIGR02145 family)